MSQFTVLQPDLCQGTVYSAPQEWEAGKTSVLAKGLLADEVLADATKNLVICIEASFDGGLTYSPNGAKSTWLGGQNNPFGPPPGPNYVQPAVGTGFMGSQSPPTHVRVRLDLPDTMSIGATVTFS